MKLSDQIKLRHLEVFVEVARRSSVTQAAEGLGLTQPAVTRALRELETAVGKPLVEKHGRGIRLTAPGELFRDYAGRAMALTRDGVALLRNLDDAEGVRVRIGALPTVSAALVPDTLASLRAEAPLGRYVVESGTNRYLLDQLRRGHLDLVVGRLSAPEHMAGLDFQPLFYERVVAVVAASHPLAQAEALDSTDFSTYPVLLPTEEAIIRPQVNRMFFEQGITLPQSAIESVSATFGRRLCLAHSAIWIISQGVVQADLNAGLLVRLPMNSDTTLGPVGLCVRSQHQLTPAAQQFCAALKQVNDVLPRHDHQQPPVGSDKTLKTMR